MKNNEIIETINSINLGNNIIYYYLKKFQEEPVIYINNIKEKIEFKIITVNDISNDKQKGVKNPVLKIIPIY